jgi:hypothetical protein
MMRQIEARSYTRRFHLLQKYEDRQEMGKIGYPEKSVLQMSLAMRRHL